MNADVTEAAAETGVLGVDRPIVDRLAARGLISLAARDAALELIEPPRRWGVWVARLLTVVGASLVLAGIVYFFAFNWERIPPLTKLAAIAGLLVIAVGTVTVVGFGRLVSDVAASAAVLLVGVFLAVQGQIYQTGADAWQLFVGWAALALPFALLAGSAAAWALWLTVANVALMTWWGQTHPFPGAHRIGAHLSIALFDAAFLVAREVLAVRGQAWVAPRWTRFILAVPILVTITQLAIIVLDRPRSLSDVERIGAVAVPVLFLGFWFAYRRWVPDVVALAAAVMAGLVITDFALFQLVTAGGRHTDLGIFFLMGLLTLGLFAAAIAWLRAVARAMEVHP
jgi:uncharacterized membrane protein